MPILTRRVGETFSIGPNIRVTVLAIDGDHLVLGIEAPSHMRIRDPQSDDGEPSAGTPPAGAREDPEN
jgi:hypothetical protein